MPDAGSFGVSVTVGGERYQPPRPSAAGGATVAVVTGFVPSILNDSETRPELATTPSTVAPAACADASAGVNVTPGPRSCAVTPDACAFVSVVVSVIPVPVAPEVPTVWIVANSWLAAVSIETVSPATMFVTLATLMFV